jgi:hypothetical protein
VFDGAIEGDAVGEGPAGVERDSLSDEPPHETAAAAIIRRIIRVDIRRTARRGFMACPYLYCFAIATLWGAKTPSAMMAPAITAVGR